MRDYTLTRRQSELIEMALREKAAALGDYLRWIDDRPQLPNVTQAIARIRAEQRELNELAYELMLSTRQ